MPSTTATRQNSGHCDKAGAGGYNETTFVEVFNHLTIYACCQAYRELSFYQTCKSLYCCANTIPRMKIVKHCTKTQTGPNNRPNNAPNICSTSSKRKKTTTFAYNVCAVVISMRTFLQTMEALKSTGLDKAGYVFLNAGPCH